jgi:hypothetical protein
MAFLLARAFGGARGTSGSTDAGAFEKMPAFGIDTEDAGFLRGMSLDTAKEFHAPKELQVAPWERQLSEGASDRSGTGTFSRQLSEGAGSSWPLSGAFSRQLSEGASEYSPGLRGRFFSDSNICKGLTPAGNSEDMQRCGSKDFSYSGEVETRQGSKDKARVEALKRAEMLARFDHSYDGRRR